MVGVSALDRRHWHVEKGVRVASSGEDGGGASGRISRFFSELEARDPVPVLVHLSGSLRFDLRDGHSVEHWFLRVKKGDVQVSRGDGDADVVFGLDRERFAAMTEGRVNAMAAALRGEVHIAGDLGLAMAFSRVFPGPPEAVGPDTPAHRVGVSR
jgi:hypothetical protein